MSVLGEACRFWAPSCSLDLVCPVRFLCPVRCFNSSRAGNLGVLTSGDVRGDVISVFGYPKDQTRSGIVQPGHAEKIEAWMFGHTASLHGKAIGIKSG